MLYLKSISPTLEEPPKFGKIDKSKLPCKSQPAKSKFVIPFDIQEFVGKVIPVKFGLVLKLILTGNPDNMDKFKFPVILLI